MSLLLGSAEIISRKITERACSMEQDSRARGRVGQETVVSVLSLTYCSLLYAVCVLFCLKKKTRHEW